MFNRNDKKKPLSESERETLKRLRESLPEYEIFPNMRLADVIKADWRQFNFIKGFHLDFVICDQNGHTVAAVELDDSTHDNPKAQERDAKKNKWLHDAGIRLIRIREPQEATNIRLLLSENILTGSSQDSWRTEPHTNIHRGRNNKDYFPFQKIAFLLASVFSIWLASSYIGNTILKRNSEQILQMQQRMAAQQSEALQRSQSVENQVKQQVISTQQQPRYEKLLIRAKSARECARPDGTLDNYTALCMSDHYETVLVSGNP